MNEVDRQVLSFMRDVKIPEQGAYYLSLINDNVEYDVRQAHLGRLEARNLIEVVDPDVPSYGLTAEGLQAIVTEDLNQTLSDTNQRLLETRTELEDMRESQSRSAAVQTIFSVTIILFTTYQIVSRRILLTESGLDQVTIAVVVIGIVLAGLAILFGASSLYGALASFK